MSVELRDFLDKMNVPQELKVKELSQKEVETHKGVKVGNKTYQAFYYKDKIYGFI